MNKKVAGSLASSKKPILTGLFFGFGSLLIYLTIVIITTPNLKPIDAVSAAIAVNWWVMAGVSLGVGTQSFLLSYAKINSCRIYKKGEIKAASGALSVLSSFLSYFALIQVGCCGTWLYLISFLPGLIGTGLSAALIKYNTPLIIISFVLMFLSILYTYHSVKKNRVRVSQQNVSLSRK